MGFLRERACRRRLFLAYCLSSFGIQLTLSVLSEKIEKRIPELAGLRGSLLREFRPFLNSLQQIFRWVSAFSEEEWSRPLL